MLLRSAYTEDARDCLQRHTQEGRAAAHREKCGLWSFVE